MADVDKIRLKSEYRETTMQFDERIKAVLKSEVDDVELERDILDWVMADARYTDPTPDDPCVTSEEIRSASEVLWDVASEEEDAEVKDYLQDLALKWKHLQSNAI